MHQAAGVAARCHWMNPELDIAAIALFEEARALSPAARQAWLVSQPVPAAVTDRVRRLLQAELDAGEFLNTAVAGPNTLLEMTLVAGAGDRVESTGLLRAVATRGIDAQPLDRELERIVAKALHPDARRRYHSAAALVEDLRRWLAGEPASQRRGTRVWQAHK